MLGRFARWLVQRASDHARGIDRAKRAEVREQPFPEAWRAHVAVVPQTRRLNAAQRAKLEADVLVFVHEKPIEGEGGFVVDERARVIVATCAALLALGRDIAVFDHVECVTIVADIDGDYAGFYQNYEGMIRTGAVGLSWSELERSFNSPSDGQNTPLHELAHAFDDADGKMDTLQTHPHYDRWRAKLRELPLGDRIEDNMLVTELIGDVEGPELFASASELFFECPSKLRDLDAELFEELVAIYGFDPRQLV